MARIGRPLQFPGSPDTLFQVQTAYPVPDQEKTVWVPSILSEPGGDASQSVQYEVVWTLREETDGWRIAGFTTEQGPGLDPLPINFENGAEMEQRLSQLSDEEVEPTENALKQNSAFKLIRSLDCAIECSG